MILGDARSGKLADNITGFVRALRRAGLPLDAARTSLAIEAVALVGVDRKGDLEAALQAVLVCRQQDLEVFQQMFSAFFKNPELTRQLLSQLLPKAPGAAPAVPRKARVQEATERREDRPARGINNRRPPRPLEGGVELGKGSEITPAGSRGPKAEAGQDIEGGKSDARTTHHYRRV